MPIPDEQQRDEQCAALESRLALIKSGRLDDEAPDFRELAAWLRRVPCTWLPGLLSETILACELRDVFQAGGMQSFTTRAIAYAQDPQSPLRRDDRYNGV